jgi:hypothetical protein
LINVIEQSVILAKKDHLDLNLKPNAVNGKDLDLEDTPTLDYLERRYVQYILKRINGRIAGAAVRLTY